MACLKPLQGWWSKAVSPKTGRRMVVFNAAEGMTDLPPVMVPCNQCRFCNMKKAADWATRAEKESKMHSQSAFITLTYTDENLPLGSSTRSTVSKREWQLFMKRLRREYPEAKMRFISCGEYGDASGRAHYHGLIFGWFPPDFVKLGNKGLGTSAALSRIWGLGFTTVGNVTWKSAAYVAGYVRKKFKGPRALAEYPDREPPFGLQSRRPGIGSTAYDTWKADWYPSLRPNTFKPSERPPDGQLEVGEGKPRPTPRYFDDKFRAENPAAHAVMKLRRACDAAYTDGLNGENHLATKLAIAKARDYAREPGGQP